MEYTHQLDDQIAEFRLQGSLLSETDRDSIKADLTKYIEDGIVHFLIDLTDLKHVNSTGLGIFITLYTRVRGKSGEMVINNPSENIQNLLKITKLDSVFSITDSRAEAVERLKAHLN